jgi:hypothetical protein
VIDSGCTNHMTGEGSMYPCYFCYLYLTVVVKPLNVIRMWMLPRSQAKLLDHLNIHQIVAATSVNDCMHTAVLDDKKHVEKRL